MYECTRKAALYIQVFMFLKLISSRVGIFVYDVSFPSQHSGGFEAAPQFNYWVRALQEGFTPCRI